MASTFDSDDIEVSPEQTAKALADGSATVVDVREQDEWDAGRIDGTTHIELNSLTSAAMSGQIPKDKPIVFYCRVGGRSSMAAQAFRASGFEAYSMAGGILLWDDQRRPLVPEGGEVADH